MTSYKIVDKDCKSWFNEGYNINGVYTINPDEQTPFEVRRQDTTDLIDTLLYILTGLL